MGRQVPVEGEAGRVGPDEIVRETFQRAGALGFIGKFRNIVEHVYLLYFFLDLQNSESVTQLGGSQPAGQGW